MLKWIQRIAFFCLIVASADGGQLRRNRKSLVKTNLVSSLVNKNPIGKNIINTKPINSNLVVIGPNLTAIVSSMSSVSSTSGNLTNDPFQVDEIRPKSKFYTVKNGTTNSLTTIKYKRNNTERLTDQSLLSSQFTSFGCDLCSNGQNCTQQTCQVYFKCSTPGHRNVSQDLATNLAIDLVTDLATGSNSQNRGLSDSDLGKQHDNLSNSNHSKTGNTYGENLSPKSIGLVSLIAKHFYCDSICDCLQCEDEINCSLTKCEKPNEIMCQDRSSCIEPSKICDGAFQCKDHSDEIGCCSYFFFFFKFFYHFS